MPKITSVIIITVGIYFLMIITPNITALEPGENEYIEMEGSPISSITHEETSFDGIEFEINIELIQNASQNGTVVEIWTQICINSGICYDPVWHCAKETTDSIRCTKELTKSSDNSTWTVVVIPDNTHTYVNYKVALKYEDGDEEMFSSGKVWSDCWVYGEESGGRCVDSTPPVPSVGIVSVLAVGFIGAVLKKR